MILQDKLAKMVILNKIDLNLSEHNEYRFEYINDTFHHITLIYLHKYQYVAQIRKSLFPHKLHLEEFVKIFITARSELVSRSFSQPASLSIFNERFLRKKRTFCDFWSLEQIHGTPANKKASLYLLQGNPVLSLSYSLLVQLLYFLMAICWYEIFRFPLGILIVDVSRNSILYVGSRRSSEMI